MRIRVERTVFGFGVRPGGSHESEFFTVVLSDARGDRAFQLSESRDARYWFIQRRAERRLNLWLDGMRSQGAEVIMNEYPDVQAA